MKTNVYYNNYSIVHKLERGGGLRWWGLSLFYELTLHHHHQSGEAATQGWWNTAKGTHRVWCKVLSQNTQTLYWQFCSLQRNMEHQHCHHGNHGRLLIQWWRPQWCHNGYHYHGLFSFFQFHRDKYSLAVSCNSCRVDKKWINALHFRSKRRYLRSTDQA